MLLDLLLISAIYLGFGFVAGLVIWLGLVVRRATLRERREVVGPGTAASQSAAEGRLMVTYPSASSSTGAQGGEWGTSAPVRRAIGGRELLSFPK